MNRLLTLTLAALAATTLVAADMADAKRLGGGRSIGVQRTAPTQSAQPAVPPSAAPKGNATGPAADPVMPRQSAAQPTAAAKAAPGAAAAAPKSGMSRWLGPIAGLAAGLGLAALASHLGIAEELMSVLLLVGLALVAFVVIRMLLARRTAASPAMQYAGSHIGQSTQPRGYETQAPTIVSETPRAAPVTPAPTNTVPRVPPGFDSERFVAEAKHQFVRLQEAFDRGDRRLLADVTTPMFYSVLAVELAGAAGKHPTEIVALNGELIEVVTEGSNHWASVRFRGLTREDGEPMPKPFDEMWNLVKPVDGSSGWQLAGIQQVEALA